MSGVERIAAERARQIAVEGRTPQHDTDQNAEGELAWAAACYAAPEYVYRLTTHGLPLHGGGQGPDLASYTFIDGWPLQWDPRFDKRLPRDHPFTQMAHGPNEIEARVRELEKAGALIAAEIDRLTGAGP